MPNVNCQRLADLVFTLKKGIPLTSKVKGLSNSRLVAKVLMITLRLIAKFFWMLSAYVMQIATIIPPVAWRNIVNQTNGL